MMVVGAAGSGMPREAEPGRPLAAPATQAASFVVQKDEKEAAKAVAESSSLGEVEGAIDDDSAAGAWDEKIRRVFQRAVHRATHDGDGHGDAAEVGLLASEPYLRAQAVASLTSVLRDASDYATDATSAEPTAKGLLDRSGSSRSSNAGAAGPLLIQELDSADDATVAAMQRRRPCDCRTALWGWWWGCCWACSATTSPTYLGAAQALRTLLGMAGGGRSANRRRPRSARRRLRAVKPSA